MRAPDLTARAVIGLVIDKHAPQHSGRDERRFYGSLGT
jgi:hypothetical protein